MYCHAASLLLKLSILLSGKATRACLRTTTSTPGVVTPPCGQCTFGSYYVTDQCMDEGGCMVFPYAQVSTEVTTAGGCREVQMTCPAGSRVTFTSGGVTVTTSWALFIDPDTSPEHGGWNFQDIVCDDSGMWSIFFGTKASPLESIYCFIKRCSQCADIPATTDLCTSGACQPADITYVPPNPTAGDDCRIITIECPAAPTGFTNALIQFIMTNGDVDEYAQTGLLDGTAIIECSSSNAVWTVTTNVETKTVSSVQCVYSPM